MTYITEEQVRKNLSVPDCIKVLREAFSHSYVNIPRYRLKSTNALLHVMSASIPDLGIIGLKTYTTTKDGNTFVVLLFQEKSGELLAVVEADSLGQIRTGAASGLATDLLARQDAKVAAIIGTGYQAETQLLAIQSVRDFKETRVFSRSPQNREEFAKRMEYQIRGKLIITDSAEVAVRDADVICTITGSKEPVLHSAWLKPGCHINAAGSNWATKRELDPETVRKCNFICVDHREQSRIESGDLVDVIEDWDRIAELADVVKGLPGRTAPDQVTLFKSNGIALEDIAAANFVYHAVL